MYDNITPEQHQAQVAALNHEIYTLNMKLRQQEEAFHYSRRININNPFDNPTEYPDYNGDYREIVPQIELPGCVIPVEPHKGEKRRLKKFYSIGGSSIFFHFLFTTTLTTLLFGIITFILQAMNPGKSYNDIYDYAYQSSILIALSAIIFGTANILFSYIGFRRAKINSSSLYRKTRNFSVGTAVKYCLIGLSIHYAAALAATAIASFSSEYGIETNLDTTGMASSGIGFMVLVVYQSIVAPITEEIFYRGLVLKTFSRANQRFAIFASAFFFGLAHGNIPQFCLAFLLGVFLAHIDIKHNSIIPSIIVHLFINTTATILNAASEYGGTLTITILEIVYIAAAAVGLAFLISFIRKNMIPRTTPQQSRRGFAVAKTSLMVIAAFIALLGNTILTIVGSSTGLI